MAFLLEVAKRLLRLNKLDSTIDLQHVHCTPQCVPRSILYNKTYFPYEISKQNAPLY